jgi:hypothetical protein
MKKVLWFFIFITTVVFVLVVRVVHVDRVSAWEDCHYKDCTKDDDCPPWMT